MTFAYATQPKCGGYNTPSVNIFRFIRARRSDLRLFSCASSLSSRRCSFTSMCTVEGSVVKITLFECTLVDIQRLRRRRGVENLPHVSWLERRREPREDGGRRGEFVHILRRTTATLQNPDTENFIIHDLAWPPTLGVHRLITFQRGDGRKCSSTMSLVDPPSNNCYILWRCAQSS